MTAPDPGLTDLIAAHREGEPWTEYQYPSIFNSKPFVAYSATKMVKCSCGESMSADSFPAHVALVVEQHTNGRIAELEAAVRKRIQLLREHDGFGAAHADGYMGMNWTAYYEGAYQAQVMAAADLENDLRAALEGEQQ